MCFKPLLSRVSYRSISSIGLENSAEYPAEYPGEQAGRFQKWAPGRVHRPSKMVRWIKRASRSRPGTFLPDKLLAV